MLRSIIALKKGVEERIREIEELRKPVCQKGLRYWLPTLIELDWVDAKIWHNRVRPDTGYSTSTRMFDRLKWEMVRKKIPFQRRLDPVYKEGKVISHMVSIKVMINEQDIHRFFD